MRSRLALLAAATLLLSSACVARAQERGSESTSYVIVEHEEPSFTVLAVTGGIVPPLAGDVAARLARIPAGRRVLIDLDSAGGEMAEGLKLIALLKREKERRQIDTLVYYGHLCASMCVPVYMMGKRRYAAAVSNWMFHPAHFGPLPVIDRGATVRVLDLMVDLGISRRYLTQLDDEDVFSTDSEYWTTGSELYAEKAGIVTDLLPQKLRHPDPEIAFDPQIQPR
ncbi:MAG TPA: hypothetical protein VKY65_06995 [Alphaproteobacteria bacterium]|nr:hypothetical protein [Alphaproteobacteria bacterium]